MPPLNSSRKKVFISPTGEVTQVYNLRQFCRENGLDASNMAKVLKGKYKHSQGWTCP